jgi:hypothetical protein
MGLPVSLVRDKESEALGDLPDTFAKLVTWWTKIARHWRRVRTVILIVVEERSFPARISTHVAFPFTDRQEIF